MSALAKLRGFSQDAIEAAVAPLVSSLDAKRRADDEVNAAACRAELKQHLGNMKAIRQADASLAKAKADEARAVAEMEKAKAARLDAEVLCLQVREPWTRERDRLCRGAYAPHVKAEALQRVNAAIEKIHNSKRLGVDAPLRSLLKLRTRLTGICDGAEAPPADDLIAWVSEKLAGIDRDLEVSALAYAEQRANAARADVLQRVLT